MRILSLGQVASQPVSHLERHQLAPMLALRE
jgi:hypothetical protein